MNGISPTLAPVAVVDQAQRPRKPKPTEIFNAITLQQAQTLVGSRKNEQAETNLAFLRGDHWQNGAGWVGPTGGDTNEAVGLATTEAIKNSFVSRNAISEITDRHVGGVLGREPHWKFTVKRPLKLKEVVDELTGIKRMEKEPPSTEEQQLINEAEAALVQWWDERGVLPLLRQMTSALLNTKRGVLRLYVPDDLRDESGNLPPGDLATCLGYIHLQHLGTDPQSLEIVFPSATVFTDPSSQRKLGVFTYDDNIDLLIQAGIAQTGDQQQAELTYLDELNNTILRVMDRSGNLEEPVTMPLGGRLTIYEATRHWLTTPQIVSQQKLLNLSMTMKQRNAILGGFLERVFLNVKWPGKYVDDPDAPGGKRFVRDPFRVGAGVMASLQGVEITDGEGKKSVADPRVNYRDPVSPATFIETEGSAYRAILQESNQLHYLLAGDATSSGESRKQARDAFTQDLRKTAQAVEAASRWILETALALASYFANRPLAFEPLRVYVQTRVQSGPISSEEMRAAKEMHDAEIWSLETTQSETGIEDVDAENARITKEKLERTAMDTAALLASQRLLDQQTPTQEGNPAPGEEEEPEEDTGVRV